MIITRRDTQEGERVTRALLENTGFAGFTFFSSFTLRFSRAHRAEYLGHALPAEVDLMLHGTWWFGELALWQQRVAQLAPLGSPEPAEPVQALELATLRWTDRALVETTELSAGTLTIRFCNGQLLTASSSPDEGDPAWSLTVAGEREPDATWSVISDGRELFVRRPGEA